MSRILATISLLMVMGLATAADVLSPSAFTREYVKAARANYETSKASFLELVTAHRRVVEAQLMRQEAIVSMHRRKAELDRVTGQVAPDR